MRISAVWAVLLLCPSALWAQPKEGLPDNSLITADVKAPSKESLSFARLAGDYWEALMRLSPLDATFNNYPRYGDRLDDNSAAGRRAKALEYNSMLKRLDSIDASKLAANERLSAEVMRWQLSASLEAEKHKNYQWLVDHMDGPQALIANIVEQAQPMRSSVDAEALLRRMQGLPLYFRNEIEGLREGAKEKRVSARVPVEKAITQIEDILKTPADQSPYASAAKKLPDGIRERYTPLIMASVEQNAYGAEREYLKFLKEEYLPKTRREKIGLGDLPGGKADYRFAIKQQTTVDKTPEELHKIGLEELAGIHREMKAIAAKMGRSEDVTSFLAAVRKDKNNYFKTREELLRASEAFIGRAREKLPRYFGILPKADVVVKPVEDFREKNSGAAEYYPAPDDLSRPGIYYVNTYRPETRATFDVASTAAHEALPGHHLQITIATEQRGLPTFQRHTDFTAYVEGWALYCERLADEMGLYTTDMDRLGMLSNQALRASRLVVDTGIHAMSWSRQQAIDFMLQNTPLSKEEIATEVDRYTVWPGQALAYKVGQREITALRREQEKRLGAAFDIKAFHDAVLKNGPLPLPVLRRTFQQR